MPEAPKLVREGMVVRMYRLGEEPGDDLSATTNPSERFEMVWLLTQRMWEWMGREMPAYDRSQTPVRLTRRS